MIKTTQTDLFKQGEGNLWFQRNQGKRGPLPHLEIFSKYLKPGMKVLEIGCADGSNLDFLEKSTGCLGFGVDPSSHAISQGQKLFPKLKLKEGSAELLSFADGEFDLVYFGFCLYLVDRSLLPRVVAESDRVLRDQGFLAITDFSSAHKSRTAYSHAPGLFSFRTNNAALWTSFHYALAEQISFSHHGPDFHVEDQERIAHTVLFKDLSGSYPLLGKKSD